MISRSVQSCRCISFEDGVAKFFLKANEIENAWSWIYGTWFPDSGYQPGDTVPYQFYPVPPENGKMTVEIRVPVKSME